MTKIILRGQNANLILRQTGRTGPPGEGVPEGGLTDQVLTKTSDADFDTEWSPIPSAPVQSVNGQTGDVVLDKSDLGLGNVDNTSDADKPISTATQAALDTKADEDGVILVGGQASSGSLTFGTTNNQGFTVLLNNNPFIVVNDIGNMSINTGSAPSVPFLVGGGLFTSAGSVFAQINPDSGTELAIGTTTNHPVNLHANGNTALTLNTDGSVNAGANSVSSTFVPSADAHLTNKLYVDNAVSGVSTSWGSITGTLSDQTDLQNALDAKADGSELGNYVLKAGDTMTGELIAQAGVSAGPVAGFGNAISVLRDGIQVGRIDNNQVSGGGMRVQAMTGQLQLRGSSNNGLLIGATFINSELPIDVGNLAVGTTFVPTGPQHLTNKLYVDQQVAAVASTPAAFVDPSTGTIEELINSLIAAGHMDPN